MKHLTAQLRRLLPKRFRDDRGATMLEWSLLLGGVAIPMWIIIRMGLNLLAAHYGLVTTMNQLPFP